jgi:hypothetical protein
MIFRMLKQGQYRNVTIAVVAGVVILFALAWYFGPSAVSGRNNEKVRTTLESFGAQLKNVSLGGTDAAIKEAIQANYAEYVTPELLAAWLANPKLAPGRMTSSPSPDRIGVATIDDQGSGKLVSGEIILVSSTEEAGESVDTIPFVAQLIPIDGEWRIAAFEDEEVQTVPVTSDED